jgi:hypothetical protein
LRTPRPRHDPTATVPPQRRALDEVRPRCVVARQGPLTNPLRVSPNQGRGCSVRAWASWRRESTSSLR